MIQVAQYEFYGLLFGWVLAVVFGLLTLAAFKITPAKAFLKAWFKKTPIAWVKDRTGRGEFMVTSETDPGSIDVKGLGFVHLVEGSMVREKNSKAPVFDVFAEFGTSIPREYAANVQELREAGFKINDFRDYKHLVDLASNKRYADEYVKSMKTEKKKQEAEELVQQIQNHQIEVKPYKTYKVHELAFMFPFNISPVYVDAKVTNAVNRMLKKEKLKKEFMIYAAMAVLIIVVAIVIFLKVIKTPEPQVIIKTVETGVMAAGAVSTGNLTI